MMLKPLDGGWGWVVAAAGSLVHLCLLGSARCLGIIYIEIKNRYQVSAKGAALAISIYTVLRQVLSPVTAVVSEKVTCRWSVVAGSVLAATGLALSAFATNISHLYVTFGVLGGIGCSFIDAPTLIIITQYFDKRKGKALSLATFGGGFGGIIWPYLYQTSVETYGYPGVMFLTAGLLLHIAIAGSLFRPLAHNKKTFIGGGQETHSDTKQKVFKVGQDEANICTTTHDDNPKFIEVRVKYDKYGQCKTEEAALHVDRMDADVDDNKELSSDVSVRIQQVGFPGELSDRNDGIKKPGLFRQRLVLLKNISFLLFCLNNFSMPHGLQCVLMLLPPLAEERGCSLQEAAILLSMSGVADIVGRLMAGIIFDLQVVRGRRRPLHSILGIGLGISVAIFAVISDFNTLLVAVITWGLLCGAFNSQRATILSEFVPLEQQGFAIGWIVCSQGIGNSVAPIISGMLFDNTGSYAIAYLFMAAVVCGTSFFFLLDFIIHKILKTK